MPAKVSTEKLRLRAPRGAFAGGGHSVTPHTNMDKIPAKLFFAPGILLGTAKPEHSLYNAVFWLLVLLAVFIATLAVKVVFGIVDREIEQWRNRRGKHHRSLRAAAKNKHEHPEKEEGLY